MSFLKKIQETGIKEISLILSYNDNDEVVLMINPVSSSEDKATRLQPLILRGKVQEVEDELYEKGFKALKKTGEFFSGVVEYEKLQEEKRNQTKEVKEKKDQITKIVKDLTETMKLEKPDTKKIEKLVKDLRLIDPTNKIIPVAKLAISQKALF